MTKFVAAVLIVIASVGAANAHPLDDEDGVGAGGCAPWVCGENGPQLTGIQVDGNRSSALAAAVTLPSGEIVRLGATASEQPRLQVAFGGMCPPMMCNGPQLTGIQVDGNRSSALTAAVTLPSGEIVRLGATASGQPRLQVAAKKGLRDKAQQYETAVRDKQVTPAEQSSRHGMSAGTARRR
jgi:hypothetical protein